MSVYMRAALLLQNTFAMHLKLELTRVAAA
jgi:hypothetical protein